MFLLFPPLPGKESFTAVFRVTEKPAAITRGTYGSALTVNISFGDAEVEQWIRELGKPYPLLLVDVDWAGRFPETVRLINDKNIPVGLLGYDGAAYDQSASLLVSQLEIFENFFGVKPLWFRTVDEVFPPFLQSMLWEAEVNALGSSFTWRGGDIPPATDGEIISVPHHRTNRVSLPELKRLSEGRSFQPMEDVLFGTTVKIKKIPG